MTPDASLAAPPVLAAALPETAAEAAVHARLTDGPDVQLVHFWAPWCDNSIRELPAWAELRTRRPDVPVAFVTVWNDGQSGADTLATHGLAGLDEIVQTHDGSHDDKDARRRRFLGLPLTWIPTTWVVRRGVLAFACAYGEMDAATLGTLIEAAERSW